MFESDFGGLEIEDSESQDMADDLDLSGDFEADEGDMVFAAEGNQMSTKLDLARAYMDMGDGDGARQIDQTMLKSESQVVLLVNTPQHLLCFGHDFGANVVPRQN